MPANKFPPKRLGEILRHVRRPITPEVGRSYSLVGVRWYGAGTHLHDTISGDALQAPVLWKVLEGDVIYNKMWTSKGAFAVVTEENSNLYGTSEYPTFETIADTSSEFLNYAFKQVRFWKLAEAWTNGTTERARLSSRDFLKLSLPIPMLAEQHAIAEVLRAVEEVIARTETLIEATRATLNSTLNWFFGKDKPTSAPIVSFSTVIESTKYGTSAKCDDDARGYAVLRIPNVLSGGISQKELKFTKLSPLEAKKFYLKEGDLLAVRTNGNPNYIGRMALVSNIPEYTLFASYLIRIRIDVAKALPAFVWLCSETFPLRDTLTSAARTSAGNFNINTDGVRSALIPLPKLADQRRIVAAAETLRTRIDAEIAYLNTLRQTHAALAQELLSGRLRLPKSIIARHRDAPAAAA